MYLPDICDILWHSLWLATIRAQKNAYALCRSGRIAKNLFPILRLCCSGGHVPKGTDEWSLDQIRYQKLNRETSIVSELYMEALRIPLNFQLLFSNARNSLPKTSSEQWPAKCKSFMGYSIEVRLNGVSEIVFSAFILKFFYREKTLIFFCQSTSCICPTEARTKARCIRVEF